MDDADRLIGMNRRIARRDVLHGAAVLAATARLSPAAAADATVDPPARTGLRGDHPGSFEAAHRLRDGTLPLPAAGTAVEQYDLVIVGGGISGLSAATPSATNSAWTAACT